MIEKVIMLCMVVSLAGCSQDPKNTTMSCETKDGITEMDFKDGKVVITYPDGRQDELGNYRYQENEYVRYYIMLDDYGTQYVANKQSGLISSNSRLYSNKNLYNCNFDWYEN